MTLRQKIFYLVYISLLRFTPEDYRPYSFCFPWLRNYFVRNFLSDCGISIRVKHNADVSPNIKLGDYSELGQHCLIHAGVSIGSNVIMGPSVKIYTRNHNFARKDIPIANQGKLTKPTVIGDDVWIGANVIILPGVSVGKGCVLGAGSVISKDIPEYAVVVGNPAKIIKFR